MMIPATNSPLSQASCTDGFDGFREHWMWFATKAVGRLLHVGVSAVKAEYGDMHISDDNMPLTACLVCLLMRHVS